MKSLSSIQPFYVMALLERAKALEQEGVDVVHMEIGEPDFPTPPAVVRAGVEAIRTGDVKYTSAGGLPELRDAIARFYRQRYQVTVPARRIFVTTGASGAFSLLLAGLLDAGGEVLLADPGYPCYPNFVRVYGASPRYVPVSAKQDFQLSADLLEQFWHPETRGVILASPGNPTGTLIAPDELARISALVAARDGFLISDEIYHGLTYAAPAQSALAYSERAFVVNSFSKYFGMTGWRLGWAVVPDDFVELAERLAQNLFIAAPTHSQRAALAAFHPETVAELEQRRMAFAERRDFLLSALAELGFAVSVKPEGAFYVYADCSRWTQDSFAFAWRLLEEAHVAVTPGRDFGANAPERYLRFAYTRDVASLSAGLARIGNFLERAD